MLRRKPGETVTVTHGITGDQLRIQVKSVSPRSGQVELAFEDDLRNFEIRRAELEPAEPLPTR